MTRSLRVDGLHVLADDGPHWKHDPVAQAEAACAGGAKVVQLRAKHATDTEVLGWARAIREVTTRSGVGFILNDRFDLALLTQADGVHLGQGDLPPGRIPSDVRDRLCVGRSTHDPAQVEAALQEDVDYVAFGPLFGTTSKQSEYDERGLEALRGIANQVAPLPLVAIGGIDVARIGSVREAGAAGAAVISAVVAADDPQAATRELVAAFEAGA